MCEFRGKLEIDGVEDGEHLKKKLKYTCACVNVRSHISKGDLKDTTRYERTTTTSPGGDQAYHN